MHRSSDFAKTAATICARIDDAGSVRLQTPGKRGPIAGGVTRLFKCLYERCRGGKRRDLELLKQPSSSIGPSHNCAPVCQSLARGHETFEQ